MKKLSKIMLSVAAAFVVTAAMAVTAMADDTITGTYDNDTGVVTMNGVVGSGASQTLLVLNNNVTEVENSSDIAYINQIDNNGTFSTFTLAAGLKPATASESVKFNIKVGGTDGTVQTGTLTIAGDAPATVTIVIGNINGDAAGAVNATDLLMLGRYVKGTSGNKGLTGNVRAKADGTNVVIGDINFDANGAVNATDLLMLGRYVKGTSGNKGHAGESVDVLVEASAE